MTKKVGVAILGLGVVGGGTYRTLVDHREFYLKTQNVDIVVECVLDKNRYDVADMILSNEEIYNNKHFIVNSDYNVPVVSCDTDKKVSIVKAILSNPQLYKSPKVYENLYEIIEHERLDILKDVLIPDEHVLKHPRLK